MARTLLNFQAPNRYRGIFFSFDQILLLLHNLDDNRPRTIWTELILFTPVFLVFKKALVLPKETDQLSHHY